MTATVNQVFRQSYRQEPTLLVQAPGRINLIGEHTDYNDGFVLPAAIDKYIWFALGPSKEEYVCIWSLDYGEQLQFPLADDFSSDIPAWGRYLHTATQELQERGYKLTPFQMTFGGDIPTGAGLSSSAALCCGFIYGLSELFNLEIAREEIALIAQATEHRIGLNCGLMDQYAVLFGKVDRVLFLDCQSLQYQHFPLELGEYTLVVINSMVQHELAAESGYNERRAACERVVARIRSDHPEVKTLRAVNRSLLKSYQNDLSAEDYRRARYVLDENQRVQDTVAALQRGDIQEAGALIFRSHAGMRDDYQITTPELDKLVELAREHGALGARMMGGGFGGCTVNLLEKNSKEETVDSIVQKYQRAYNLKPEVYELALSGGVERRTESGDRKLKK